MDISVIVIGDEILLGQVTDTNSGMIARTIGVAGWQVKNVITVGDDAEKIKEAIVGALKQTSVVLTTGGLGPTKDDITKNVMQEIFGGEMVWDKGVLAHLEEYCKRRQFALNELTRRQALVPDSCTVIQNDFGTAPVMEFEKDGATLISLPGVPYEATNIVRKVVFPRLLERYGNGEAIGHRTLLVYGITESALAELLADFENNLPANLHLAYLPMIGYHRLRLDGFGKDAEILEKQMDSAIDELKSIAGDYVFWDKDMTIQEIAKTVVEEHNYTFCTAESCTGGNIAHLMTTMPGVSKIFKGSVVAYCNDLKVDLLSVDRDILKQYGAVSLPVAEQMARGVCKLLKADCSVATSGIAGPDGGTSIKPVGTVCIAVSTPDAVLVDHYLFGGNRQSVIDRASNVALIKLIRLLLNGDCRK